MCILQQPKNETGIHTFLLRRKAPVLVRSTNEDYSSNNL